MAPQEPLYTQLCVWTVTAVGCVVVVAFGVYFVVVLMRLIRAALMQAAPTAPQHPQPLAVKAKPSDGQCPCGGDLGPVEQVAATDDGVMEQRTCTVCRRKQMVPRA